MKLHLTRSLRAALLACVCSCVAVSGQSMAEEITWVTPGESETQIPAGQGIKLTESKNYGNLWMYDNNVVDVAEGVTATAVLDATGSYVKTGLGTLKTSGSSPWNAPLNLDVLEGTFDAGHNSGDNASDNPTPNGTYGFVRGTASVAAGATLILSGNDVLHYNDNATQLVTLTGSQETTEVTDPDTLEVTSVTTTKKATLQVDEHQTLTTNISLNGHTEIKSVAVTEVPAETDGEGNVTKEGYTYLTGNLEGFGGTITATGTDNTISTTLKTRKAITLDVTGADDDLTVSGIIERSTNGDYNEHSVTKTGEGTLILASSAQVKDVDLIIDNGAVRPEGNIDRSYILRGGTIELHDNRIGNDNGTTTGTITLAKETDGTTSENTIKSIPNTNGEVKAGAVFSKVTGEGNLTLSNSVNVYSDMDHTGNVTLQSGHYNIGHSGYGDSPTIANIGDITIAADATATVNAKSANAATQIQNDGNITVNGKLEVSKGTIGNSGTITVTGEGAKLTVNSQATITSDITVSNGGTLDVGNSPTMSASAVTIADGGVLDLKDTLTLSLESLDLAANTTVVLGKDTRIEISDALTVGSGVIFDVSSWCTNDEYTPIQELFTYTGEGAGFDSALDGITVAIKTSTGTNSHATLRLENGSVALVPEPTTATLSLLALAGLAARRRRK